MTKGSIYVDLTSPPHDPASIFSIKHRKQVSLRHICCLFCNWVSITNHLRMQNESCISCEKLLHEKIFFSSKFPRILPLKLHVSFWFDCKYRFAIDSLYSRSCLMFVFPFLSVKDIIFISDFSKISSMPKLKCICMRLLL